MLHGNIDTVGIGGPSLMEPNKPTKQSALRRAYLISAVIPADTRDRPCDIMILLLTMSAANLPPRASYSNFKLNGISNARNLESRMLLTIGFGWVTPDHVSCLTSATTGRVSQETMKLEA
jgi:hypothetical protein